MINIKIYCNKKHEAYERIYKLIHEVMFESNHCFDIIRISEPKVLRMQNIIQEPHIVFNNQVVYAGISSTKDELRIILQRLKLIK